MVNKKPDALERRGKPSVSIRLRVEPSVLDALDKFIALNGPLTRSAAALDLLTDELVRLGILRPTKEMTEH